MADEIFQRFLDAGAVPVETPILQPAGTLLDLYGEDIRARAYVTSDPERGEQMVRPDFTVPVVQRHMEEGAEPARYTYMGLVFRKQEAGSNRATEYPQVGYEIFDRIAPLEADAEVFALVAEALGDTKARPVIGDIGILMAAVDGLSTSNARRAALKRHVWRPNRFRDMLERFSNPVDARRNSLLSSSSNAQAIGLRSQAEVQARLDALKADQDVAPIASVEAVALEAILNVKDTAPAAVGRLSEIGKNLPAIMPALDRLVSRLDALDAKGVGVETLAFEGSYGRTSMEYYDGFAFGFHADGFPPIATGGRYDALTRVLGQGREIPAVGAVIRPDLVEALA